MRRLLVGLFLLSFLIPGAALAETKGEVQSLGFGWHYRPNCHVPMLVRVQADKSGTYQIQVIQEDMDRDQQIFVQTVSLTGADEGGAVADQRFWLYFIPQPINGGLSGLPLRELQQQLKVFLCDERGRQITQLPVTQTAISVDQSQFGPYPTGRGTKLIIAVSDTAAQPVWRDYQNAIGTLEDVIFVTVRSSDLPEDVRGYEGIDGLVWLAAPAPDSAKPAEERRYHAIREYVRSGGHLVVCQPAQREATAEWDDLLPVTVKEVAPRGTLEPLRTLARADLRAEDLRKKEGAAQNVYQEETKGPGINDWDRPQGPFMFARAELKPHAIADDDHMIRWDDQGRDKTPYIARIGYGAGAVTWVAHDLADPVIVTRAKSGWPFVWDRVLAYNDDILILDQNTDDKQKAPYAQASWVDLGHALLGGMELPGKSNALIAIAVVFFIAYWVVAGPGVYLWLVTKARSHMSWFMFALSAVVATALTMLVVRLVVRGPPVMKHVTVVRAVSGDATISFSQFGMYIPRDGGQEFSLPEAAPRQVSYITAFPAHPSNQQAEMDFPARERYFIPLREANSEDPVEINVPYRSTLKKFQARRAGTAGGIIDGSAKLKFDERSNGLVPDGIISNGTGHRLRNIYVAYHDPGWLGTGADLVLYQPTMEVRESIDLERDFNRRKIKLVDEKAGATSGVPEDEVRLYGPIQKTEFGWTAYWFSKMRSESSSYANARHNDLAERVKQSFPMMSFFSRLPPIRNEDPKSSKAAGRAELIRRGGRHLDVSNALAAGKMVVLAESYDEVPLPFPLQVEGDEIAGKGIVFYQCILPLAHPPAEQIAATQPAASLPAAQATESP